MIAVLTGLLAAACWGAADALARRTGRALGAQGSLLAMMLAGMLALSLWLAFTGQPVLVRPSAWTVGAALLSTAAMLAFYEALRQGPVSLVSPAAGAYPAWAVILSMTFLGVRPGLATLAACGLTLAGVLLIARCTAPPRDPGAFRHATLALALVSSILFAMALLAGQRASTLDGEVLVTWWGRLTAAALMAILLLARHRRPSLAQGPAAKEISLAFLQGLLDAAGLLCVLSAGTGLDGLLTGVVSSAFGAVTVLLARIFFRERITAGQTAGMGAVFAGVAILAALA